MLWLAANATATLVALATLVTYAMVYTPLKRTHVALDGRGRGAGRAAAADRLGRRGRIARDGRRPGRSS